MLRGIGAVYATGRGDGETPIPSELARGTVVLNVIRGGFKCHSGVAARGSGWRA